MQKIFIISGPSGVGKNTVIRGLLKEFPGSVKVLNSTSRKPRKGEADLEDYRFLDIHEFLCGFEKKKFIEAGHYHGNCYGTLKSDFNKAKDEGDILFWILDVKGVKAIQDKKIKNMVYIFIVTGSEKDLEKRILKREEVPDNLKERIAHAKWEISQTDIYNYVVINEDNKTDDTIKEIAGIVEKEISR